MVDVTILAFEGSPLSSVALPADILQAAGTFWNAVNGRKTEPLFSVKIVTEDGLPVRCHRTIMITPDGPLAEVNSTDIFIVSGISDLRHLPGRSSGVAAKLRAVHAQGACIASICTGAFILASAGLLDGRKATTHWGMAQRFSTAFPKVELQIGRILTEDGNILCSGGTTAGADLALELIRRFCGEEEAIRCARVLLLDPYRTMQSAYAQLPVVFDHGDPEVRDAQQHIIDNYHKELTVEDLAAVARMSRRTFERRFKKATGNSPGQYLQRVRIESARHLLETTHKTFEQITVIVGYEDASTFRRIFSKEMGVPPSAYREKFGRKVLTNSSKPI